MLKRLLFTIAMAFSFSVMMNAQTGDLTNLSYDANVTPGQTGLTFSFDYTASAAGTYEWQLIKALPDGSPDWGAGGTVYVTNSMSMAAMATQLTFNYDIPATADTGTYTWAGKLTINGTDLGYNNTGNLVIIGTGGTSVPTGSLTNLMYDTTVVRGANGLTFSFDYTANDSALIEWQLIEALPDGSPNWGGANMAYTTIMVGASDTAMNYSFTYNIDSTADELLTYTWAGKMTIDSTDLGYNNTGNLVTIDFGVNTNEPIQPDFTIYPNPTSSHLFIQTEQQEAIFEIYNQLGQFIGRYEERGTTKMIDVSAFPRGFYIIKAENGGSMRFIKN